MDNFDLQKYLMEGCLFEENKDLELKKNKEELINMLSYLDENQEILRNELIKLISDTDDKEILTKLLNVAQTQGVQKLLNKKIIDFLKKENSRERFINPKTQSTTKTGKPSKTSRDLDFDAKESFIDLTEKHFRSKATFKIIKLLVSLVAESSVSTEEKDKFIDLLEDPSNLIPGSIFDKPEATGNVDDFLNNKITSHPLYKEIKPKLLNSVGEKATGTGEYFLTIFGERGGIPKEGNTSGNGDVFISGVDIEVKNGSSQSAIDTQITFNRLQMDRYNQKWLIEIGFTPEEIENLFTEYSKRKNSNTFTITAEFGSSEIKDKLDILPNGKEKVKEYLRGIYGSDRGDGLDDKDLDSLTNEIYSRIGKVSNKELASVVGPYIFKLYKQNKKFDVYLVIDNQGNFVSTNSNTLPEKIKFNKWVLGQGGNNYPYKGYVTVSL